MTCHAGVAWRKGRGHIGPNVKQRRRKNWTTDNVARGTPNGQTFGKRRRVQPECSTGIRDLGPIWQLCLRKKMTSGNGIREQSRRQELHLGSVKTLYEARGQTLVLEVVKREVGTSIRLHKMSDWTLRNERRDDTQSRSHKCRSTDHSWNFWLHQPKKDDGDKPGPTMREPLGTSSLKEEAAGAVGE